MPDPLYSVPAGTDGHVPIDAPDVRGRMWWKSDIWLGGPGLNKYLTRLDDLVFDPRTLTMEIVDHIDEVTYIPQLRQINFNGLGVLLSQQDMIFGVGPGTRGDDYRAYLDKSVYPHVLAIDDRFGVPGSDAAYAKIFRSSNEDVAISQIYNTSNVFVSSNIPLETVAISGHTNYHYKSIPPCKTTDDLISGDIITVKVYSVSGHVVKVRQCIIEETTAIRDHNSTGRRITGISLESAFLSPTENNLIIYPLNVPVNALNLIGVVTYNDGVVRMPVDGTKFRLHGLEQVSANMPEEVELVLQYYLSPGEVSVSPGGTFNNTISVPIRIRVAPSSWSTLTNGYAVKLFCFPQWNATQSRYQLRWFMFGLDRNVFFDVTNSVMLSADTGSFDGNAYGVLQRRRVSLRLSDVSMSFNDFTHVQLVDINLFGPPSSTGTPWTVKHVSGNSNPTYGLQLIATLGAGSTVNVSAGKTTYDSWLQDVYRVSQPIHNPALEGQAPDPTHFVLMYNGTEQIYPVSAWNQNLPRLAGMTQHQNVYIRFVRTFGGTEFLELCMAAMTLRNAPI